MCNDYRLLSWLKLGSGSADSQLGTLFWFSHPGKSNTVLGHRLASALLDTDR